MLGATEELGRLGHDAAGMRATQATGYAAERSDAIVHNVLDLMRTRVGALASASCWTWNRTPVAFDADKEQMMQFS